MEIGRKFNTFTLEEYFFYIDNHKKYKDFNTLGLYRSIVENENLTIEEKLNVREYAHKIFKKTFDFLQLKDPWTFKEVTYLGQELTRGDEEKIWGDIRKNQQSILADKKIKHRNFGEYSKHNCGYDFCHLNGIMVKQGYGIAECSMHFDSDKNKDQAARLKSKRKKEQQRIDREFGIK